MYFRIEMPTPWLSSRYRGSSLVGHKANLVAGLKLKSASLLCCVPTPLFSFCRFKWKACQTPKPTCLSQQCAHIALFARLWGRNMGGRRCLSAVAREPFYSIWRNQSVLALAAFFTALLLPSAEGSCPVCFCSLLWLLRVRWILP